ncbi:DnaB-like helicase C-terminal domain-containing protein [Streptomyces sp. NPDC001108]
MSHAPLFTGLSDFDALAGPLPAGKVTVVAGRPSVGASAFVLTAARHNLAEGHAVAFLNLQVGHDALLRNFLAAESSTNVDRWDTLNEGRLVRLKRASTVLKDTRLWTWTPSALTRTEQIAEELAPVKDLDLLIVDDYGMATTHEPSAGATLRALQNLAAARGMTVLVTAHLNRADYGQDHVVPTLADLGHRDTAVGAADAAIVLHRPDVQGSVPERRGEVDVIAARGWARAGTATVRFEPEYHRLVDQPNTVPTRTSLPRPAGSPGGHAPVSGPLT